MQVVEQKTKSPPELCFEWLKGHKVGIFVKKVFRKGLKRASRNFTFSNSPFTSQHNISMNGTKSWVIVVSILAWRPRFFGSARFYPFYCVSICTTIQEHVIHHPPVLSHESCHRCCRSTSFTQLLWRRWVSTSLDPRVFIGLAMLLEFGRRPVIGPNLA